MLNIDLSQFEASAQVDQLVLVQRPTVHARNPDLNGLTQSTWKAIQTVNDPPQLFMRGNAIVHATAITNHELITCRDIDTNRLRWWLTKHIDFIEDRDEGPRPTRPPIDLLQNLLAAPNPPLPQLIGIVTSPVFSADGILHDRPGYSPDTQRIYAPDVGFELPRVSIKPTSDETERAKTMLLDDLLGDFPFEDDSSIAHTLAALLLLFVRPMIDGPTPLHLISKPKAGTGATLLAEILCLPGCGRPSVISVGKDEEERRRTLLATLRPGPGAVLLDNVNRIEGAALSSCLTQTHFEDRLIGSSILLRVPNLCLWLATGNNPELSDEIARRTVRIHLDAKIEHPDLRSNFKHPHLTQWARKKRQDLVWAALTLIQSWIAKGKPTGSKILGKFESWAQVIGGILETANVPGFLERLDEFRAKADTETSTMRGFVEAWAALCEEREIRACDLIPLAGSFALGTGTSRSIRLGKLLGDRQGQRFGVWIIEKSRLISGYQHWRLRRVDDFGGCGGSGGECPPPKQIVLPSKLPGGHPLPPPRPPTKGNYGI
jgi:putative DNA primase/helicase